MDALETGSPAPVSREPIRRGILAGTHNEMEALKMRTERTRLRHEALENGNKAFVESISAARKRIVDAGCLDRLQKTMATLPEGSGWRRWLLGLEREATPSDSGNTERINTRPSPVAILRYIVQAEPYVMQQEARLVGDARAPARQVLAVFQSFQDAIHPLHPDAITGNPYAWAGNPDINRRAANLARVAVFTVAAAGAIATGVVALLTKENPNWKVPAVWLLFAGLAAGWGDITGSRNDRLGEQIGFLTDRDGTWNQLQQTYGLTGPAWAQFANTLMQNERGNAAVARARRPQATLTEDEKKTIIALSPSSIQSHVQRMLQSRTGDFRAFIGLLYRARTEEAQNLVTVFIQEGATADSVQSLTST